MPTTREVIVTAAVTLVGECGTTALTHRRVDARAGLPLGSTSNYFRTKAALLQGAIEGVLLFELPVASNTRTVQTREELVAAVAGFVSGVTRGSLEVVSAARLALFLEARHDADLRVRIERGRQAHIDLLAATLERVGAPDPRTGARLLVTVVEGAVVDRVTCVPDEDMGNVVELAVRAAIDGQVA